MKVVKSLLVGLGVVIVLFGKLSSAADGRFTPQFTYYPYPYSRYLENTLRPLLQLGRPPAAPTLPAKTSAQKKAELQDLLAILNGENVVVIEQLLRKYWPYQELLTKSLDDKKLFLQTAVFLVYLGKRKKAKLPLKPQDCFSVKDAHNLVQIERFLMKNFRASDGNLIRYADLVNKNFERKRIMYQASCGLDY